MVLRNPRSQGSQVARAHREIRRALLGGHYHPGAPLSESALARAHRTSRTPVREALSRLLEEGYVERVDGRGFFATRITLQIIQDTFEVRRLLEGAAAARAAEVFDPGDLARLRRLGKYHYAARDSLSHRRGVDRNVEFHLAIASASRNALLQELVEHCLTQTNWFLSLGINLRLFQEDATREHEAIVDAITRRNPTRAREAMERHLDRSRQLVIDALMRGDVKGVAV